MNNKKLVHSVYLFFTFAFILIFVNACNEYNEPPTIYNPSSSGGGVPKITSITPSGGAIAGVREIVIDGENFDTGDTTWIFVGNNQNPMIKSISNTKIVLYRPPNFGSSLDIKVVVPSGDGVARVGNYNIEATLDSVNPFLLGSGLPDYFAMEIGKDGTYYVASPRRIDTVSADGLFFGRAKERLPSSLNTFTDMKFGPGEFLYLLSGKTDIYRIDPKDTNSTAKIYASISGGTAAKFDFDDNRIMYTASSSGLYIVRPLTDSTGAVEVVNNTSKTITEVRVFNKHLYVSDSTSIWRYTINAGGGLSGEESVLSNVSTQAGLELCKISSFNIDNDGQIYICLQNHPRYSLFALESDGSVTPYYADNILPVNVRQIIWGYDSRTMFLDKGKMIKNGMRLYRTGMKTKGAPNFGRTF